MSEKGGVLDTEWKVIIEEIFLLSRIGEGDRVERDDGGRQFADILKVESGD